MAECEITVHEELKQIVMLCEEISRYAENLDRRREGHLMMTSPGTTSADRIEPFWAAALPGQPEGRADQASTATGRWYGGLETAFVKLERLVRNAPPETVARVKADPLVRDVRASLHRVRAAYEFDKEVTLAMSVLAGPGSWKALLDLISGEAFWALSPELCRVLRSRRSVAVAGSGPLPLTALSIALEFGHDVTCFERDPVAFELGSKLSQLAPCHDHVRSRKTDLLAVDDLEGYDAIVSAVLLGVGIGDGEAHCRDQTVGHLVSRMRPGAIVVTREPHGLGCLFHPPLELHLPDGYAVELVVPPSDPTVPYRSATLIIQREE